MARMRLLVAIPGLAARSMEAALSPTLRMSMLDQATVTLVMKRLVQAVPSTHGTASA
jgi:hypothetical protein